MLNDLYAQTEKKMKDQVEHIRHGLSTIRTGRASLAILDGVHVDYYGTQTPLSQVATLSIPDPTLIVAQPWDPSVLPAIEKAIQKSDLGLNPSNDGKVIRIPIPPLTEERRKDLAKKVHQVAEEGRTHIRQARRDANEAAKKLEKDKKISQDDEKRGLEQIQKMTDQHIKLIDDIAKKKEQEILQI
ncbi:MAG TPA: ribosome recycling factor [Patescibacteria group bacterium]|nr:ribosome recycling factor [Patescibacteria group bacterium]